MCVIRSSNVSRVENFLKSRPWIRVQVRRTLRPEELNQKKKKPTTTEPITVFKVDWDENLISHKEFLTELKGDDVVLSRSRFHAAVEGEIYLGEVIELDPLYQLMRLHGISEDKLNDWKENIPDSSLDMLGFSACERKLLLLSQSNKPS